MKGYMRWIYKTALKTDYPEMARELDKLGLEGWELVSVTQSRYGIYTAFFKKPAPAEALNKANGY